MGRNGIIGGALEDGHLCGFTGDMRQRLHGRGAGADDRHPQAAEINLVMRPKGGVQGLTGKIF